jgi:hypothetical protein
MYSTNSQEFLVTPFAGPQIRIQMEYCQDSVFQSGSDSQFDLRNVVGLHFVEGSSGLYALMDQPSRVVLVSLRRLQNVSGTTHLSF